MPYCSKCGALAHERDLFCGSCGTRQPSPISGPPPPQVRDPLETLSPRTASILCYIPVVGWVFAVVVLAARKFRNNPAVRFHAFQGLYLFAVWLLLDWGVRPFFHDTFEPIYRGTKLLEGLLWAVYIFMIIKASHQEQYSLPILGDLAQRSAAEH